ncbi:hypothetical protein AXF42_Ash017087 [Apostasia shenzhenica]|uniref:BAH domain-containing protein n=1 Tax=Apostasia shenzhenica TaxID=1088818 RepID=A0A2H9ZV22_9ASPA|nr:hypothetical protein AXF42_Ash017087 [Apostasia shenzhenica]
MGEDNKRLVAYVEDLYEDLRAYNMVVVRWFHKVDEVAIVLPPDDANDREIFFSLCLQDFSVECIDGLAAVLGPQDFDMFQKDGRHRCSSWEPYLCRWQIDGDDLKPFDITEVPGYWSQGLLRSMYSCIKLRLNVTSSGSSSDADKRKPIPKCGSPDAEGVHIKDSKLTGVSIESKLENRARRTASLSPSKGSEKQKKDMLAPGRQIELLSQDSGIRGCWFRCVILKRHHDRIKVQYQDLQDADGTGKLEEWFSASRIAAPDKLGIRLSGRPMVRPWPLKGPCDIGVGKIVDAWWHDGWWEGIIINNECEGRIHVFFPGEKRVSSFIAGNLRTSQEWVGETWKLLRDGPEIMSLLQPDINFEKCNDFVTSNVHQHDPSREQQRLRHIDLVETPKLQFVKESSSEKTERALPGFIHDRLRWNTTRKRTHGRSVLAKEAPPCKRQRIEVSFKGSKQPVDCSSFVLPKSLKVVDHENCKSSGDPLFGAPLTALCSSLVMTR